MGMSSERGEEKEKENSVLSTFTVHTCTVDNVPPFEPPLPPISF